MPPVSSVLENCVVGKEGGIKASPSATCARGTGRDGLAKTIYKRESRKASILIIDAFLFYHTLASTFAFPALQT